MTFKAVLMDKTMEHVQSVVVLPERRSSVVVAESMRPLWWKQDNDPSPVEANHVLEREYWCQAATSNIGFYKDMGLS